VEKQDSVDVIEAEFARTLPKVDARAATITARIRRINFHLDRNAEEVFRGFKTTGAAIDVLTALYAAGPPYRLTPTDLYRGRMMSSAGVTARLDLVERAGLAVRSRDPRDRRGVVVTLTKSGLKLVRDASQALYRRQSFLAEVYNERERKQVVTLLKRLLASMQRSGAGTSLPSFEAAIAPWLRDFPKADPWLVEFILLMAMLTVSINHETDRLLRDLNLSQTALFTLAALRRSSGGRPLLPRELSQATLLSSAGMTAQLDQLEERSLVRRSPHPEDRRAIHVTLTRTGQKTVDEAISIYLVGHERLLAGLSSGDRQNLDVLLRKLLVSLEASNGSRSS
jgi:DNA-binding MarR family transcriptional regulator